MHELSIASALVDTCVEHAGGSRVVRVRIEVGQLAGVLSDSLRFCFDVCARGAAVEGAELDILDIPGSAAGMRRSRDFGFTDRILPLWRAIAHRCR